MLLCKPLISSQTARTWHPQAEPGILAAFCNAAERVPAYRKMLERQGVDPTTIRSIDDFSSLVPLTDKDQLFGAHELPELCLDGKIAGASAAYTSSGYSGTFSFGLETPQEAERLRDRVDLMLAAHFGAPRRTTLLINALPMGVRVPTNAAMVIDTGTRTDAALAAVRKLAPSFNQIVIVAEHPLLKKMIEDGAAAGINWSQRAVHLVTGAEVMPEGFRQYIGRLLGHTPDESRGKIVVSVGISEIGLSIAQEMPFCRRVRNAAWTNAALRNSLFGQEAFVPTLAQWSPEDYWLETVAAPDGKQRLVVTTLDTHRKIPLIRYATGDWAKVMDEEEIAAALGAEHPDLGRAEFTLPFVAVFGRGRAAKVGKTLIYPEQVKEALYRDPRIAGATTGNFRLAAEDARTLRVELQLKPSGEASEDLATLFGKIAREICGVEVRAVFVPHEGFADAAQMGYQKKFQYL